MEAVFALIGIVIGAILSGTVQLFIDWRNRRTIARAAARLVFSDLFSAMEAYAEAAHKQEWWRRGDLPVQAWNQYREALAAVMDGDDFNMVNAAFQNIAYYDAVRRTAEAQDLRSLSEGLAQALATSLPEPCWLALNHLHRAGMTWRERRRSPAETEAEMFLTFRLGPFIPGA